VKQALINSEVIAASNREKHYNAVDANYNATTTSTTTWQRRDEDGDCESDVGSDDDNDKYKDDNDDDSGDDGDAVDGDYSLNNTMKTTIPTMTMTTTIAMAMAMHMRQRCLLLVGQCKLPPIPTKVLPQQETTYAALDSGATTVRTSMLQDAITPRSLHPALLPVRYYRYSHQNHHQCLR